MLAREPVYAIRPVRPEELALLPGVEQAAGRLFAGTSEAWIVDDGDHSLADFTDWLRDGAIWVAVADDRIVGFAAVETIDGQSYLHELDVHPDHGRRGLGRRLIATAVAAARAVGQTALRLSTFRHIPWNAPYYVKLGFRELPEADWGPGLREVWRAEIASGLDPARRLMLELRW